MVAKCIFFFAAMVLHCTSRRAEDILTMEGEDFVVEGRGTENLQDGCSKAVTGSVQRKSIFLDGTLQSSKSCKCPRHTHMVGDHSSCKIFSRHFNPKTMANKGCTCVEGVDDLVAAVGLPSGTKFKTWDWMKLLDDDVSINELTIPGTHDTMAYEAKAHHGLVASTSDSTGMTLTHEDHFTMQLIHGIRWFDVRIGLQGDAVVTCHGPFEMICDLECMLTSATQFLEGHPSEALFVMLKGECGDKSEHLSQRAVSLLQNSKFVLRGDAISVNAPLKTFRGHIVIMDTETWDVLPGFADAAREAQIGSVALRGSLALEEKSGRRQTVQNDFKLGITKGRESKVKAIAKFLEECSGRYVNTDSMRVNYFSASGVGYDVMTTAKNINAEVLDVLDDMQTGQMKDRGHAFGACLLDGLPTGGPVIQLIKRLIDRNFQSHDNAGVNNFAKVKVYEKRVQKQLKKLLKKNATDSGVRETA